MSSRAWGEVRLHVGLYIAEVRRSSLTLDQQGRLALAWPAVWMSGGALGVEEDEWRRELGYSADDWEREREVFSDVLEGPGGWTLRFMREEALRQAGVSARQAEKGRESAKRRASGVNSGQPVLDSGQPRSTDVNPASASALASTSESTHLSLADARSSSPDRMASTNGNGVTKRTLSRSASHLPPGWTEFWDAYPSKVGRKAAETAFGKAIKSADLPTILAGLERAKASPRWTRDGGQYIPNPATWLNQGRWDDQIPVQTQAPEAW